MNEEQYNLLTSQVKRKLNITWEEEETNLRIKDIIDNAVFYIADIIGVKSEFDFSKPSKENNLFVNYCFYEWNNASNDFNKNYLDDIMQLRQKYEVLNFEE